jgi:serine/threonine protein kinase/formylglycine-generating enzyme required for sulfatase activity
MNELSTTTTKTPDQQRLVDRVCDAFELAFRSDPTERVERYVVQLPDEIRSFGLAKLIELEIELRELSDPTAHATEFYDRFPRDADVVRAALQHRPSPPPVSDTEEPIPKRIGRFEIRQVLGHGNFGRVYLAYDSDMDRPVALKVPTRKLFDSGFSREVFLQEARSAAKVKHHGLVSVYDVQSQGEQPYIVQEYVQGQNLADWYRANRPGPQEIARLLSEVADALVELHRQAIVHRDLKPRNILVDQAGHAHVADFGLALHRSLQQERKGELAGSPAYMAPEQVRGETHNVDGRSDIWSLGVILYEMLAGSRPFNAPSRELLFESIQYHEITPPSQINPTIPPSLERICLTCLAKRMTERYASSARLLEDLRDWLANATPLDLSDTRSEASTQPDHNEEAQQDTDRSLDTSANQPRVIPKGLRSFDEHDRDFFLQLLPGVPDKHGLPPSVAFWKSRIEETDPDETFSVGVIYGPSGCGKSSLIRAGILPRLASHVLPIYVEATPADTEVRLLKRLTKELPRLAVEEPDLPTLVRRLRESPDFAQRKVLIVLDQFEQWLHSHGDDPTQPLIHALRQCDGGRVQCLVLIRDDFWMPATRFAHLLDIPSLDATNSCSVDLFSMAHAEKVLTLFGRAYERFDGEASSPRQQEFIRQVVHGLATGSRVISVRLALFADMVQDKPWELATLKEASVERVAVRFLEESFGPTAPVAYRRHQQAAQRVLAALLPEAGTDIKGSMRPRTELLAASCYTRQDEFDQLMNILNSEKRLITPTEPDESTASLEATSTDDRGHHFQLTHDYLVPSLREWVFQEKRKTMRGRAELRLAERAALWKDKPDLLPAWWEHANIALLTRRRDWTYTQRHMMRASRWRHGVRALILGVLSLVTAAGVYEVNGRIRGREIVRTLLQTEPKEIPKVVNDVAFYRRWVTSQLEELISGQDASRDGHRRQLHARLGLVPVDDTQVEPLLESLLTEEPTYLATICDLLEPYADRIVERLWSVLRDTAADASRRYRAGLALATYATDSDKWTDADAKFLVSQLVAANPVHQPGMWELLQPIAQRLQTPLEQAFLDRASAETHQTNAAYAIARFFADQNLNLARLIEQASPQQYAILFPLLGDDNPEVAKQLQQTVRQVPVDDLNASQRLSLGRRRAAAAVSLLRLRHTEDTFPALRVTDDPESLTQFVHGCRARGVTSAQLLDALDLAIQNREIADEAERRAYDRILYGLLLSLGEFNLDQIPRDRQQATTDRFVDWYATHPSSAVHGATGWLLRLWEFDEEVQRIDESPTVGTDEELFQREWFVTAIDVPGTSASSDESVEPQRIFFTFVVFPARKYQVGSPNDEEGHELGEAFRPVTVTRAFAVTDREVTWVQWNAIDQATHHDVWERQFVKQLALHDPAFGINWFEAVNYCRWLNQHLGIPEREQWYAARSLPSDGRPGWVDLPDTESWPVNRAGHGFRLLTEAEWEVVCRSETRTAYSFGHDVSLLCKYGWFMENSNNWSHPVAQQRPNLRGLFDVHGNLMEWCHDWYSPSNNVSVDSIGPDRGSIRVSRGGGWGSLAANCRAAYRDGGRPSYRNSDLGFRLARVLPSSSPVGVSGAENGGQPAPAEPDQGRAVPE